jgi:glutamate-1-semialdehyde aminotransferase
MNYDLGLISKKPEMNGFPIYYTECDGVVIDKYLDMSYMGLGTNILGYSNKEVDDFVIEHIRKGNISTLNGIMAKDLTNILLSEHKDYGFIRYTRTGGEAMKVALTVAQRYCNNNSHYFINGYHGWIIKNDQYATEIKVNDMKDIQRALEWDIPQKKIMIIEGVRDEWYREEYIEKLKEWR